MSGGLGAVWGEAAQRKQELLCQNLPETRDRLHGSLTADSDEGATPSPTELTNGREANLVLFVSHFQALIKIICSDCLGKLFFVPPFPSLYQCHFRGSRFLGGGVQTALCRLGAGGRGEAVGVHGSLGAEPDLLAAGEVGILDPPLSAGLGP